MDREQYQNLRQFVLPENFRGKNPILVQLWWIVQATVFGCSPQFMYRWRVFLLRCFGAKIGERVLVRPSARITYPWKVCIGNDSWIGDDVTLYSLAEITIGSDVVISQRSYICAATHDYSRPTFDMIGSPIVIEDQAWLATDVFVAPGVKVCRGAVVGARSSVYKDVASGSISVGNPARVTGAR